MLRLIVCCGAAADHFNVDYRSILRHLDTNKATVKKEDINPWPEPVSSLEDLFRGGVITQVSFIFF